MTRIYQGASQDASAGSKRWRSSCRARRWTHALFPGLRIPPSSLARDKSGKTSPIASVSRSILFSIYNLGAHFVSKFYDAIFTFGPDAISAWPA